MEAARRQAWYAMEREAPDLRDMFPDDEDFIAAVRERVELEGEKA